MNNAVSGEVPDFVIDYSLLTLSAGSIDSAGQFRIHCWIYFFNTKFRVIPCWHVTRSVVIPFSSFLISKESDFSAGCHFPFT